MTFFPTIREILIADAQLDKLDILLAGLAPGVETWLVQPGDDALARIFAALASPGLRKLHLLAHGTPGGIALGGRQLSAADFTQRYDGLAQRDLDIAFWSCRTGAGAAGQAFVQAVAHATGARVVAASGLVGAAAQDGSWELDGRTAAPFSAAARAAYPHVLVDHGGAFVQFSMLSPGDTNYILNDTQRNYLTALQTATGQAEIAASNGPNYAAWWGGDVLTTAEFQTLAADSKFNFNGTVITVRPDSTALSDYNAAWTALHNTAISNTGHPSPLQVAFATDATPVTLSLADLTAAPADYVAALQAATHTVVVAGTPTDFFGSASGATLLGGLPSLAGDDVTVAGALSAAQALALGTAVGSGSVTFTGGVAGTVAHFFGGAGATTLVAGLPDLSGALVLVTDQANLAQAAALATAVTGAGALTLLLGLADTAANLFAGDALTAGASALLGQLSAPSVTVSGAVDLAQAAALHTVLASHAGTLTLAGGLTDTAAHWFSGDAVNADAATLLDGLSAPSVTISDAVDVAQATALHSALASLSGTLTLAGGVTDTLAHFFGSASGATLVGGLPDLSGETVTVTGALPSMAQFAALAGAVGAGSLSLPAGGVADTVANLFNGDAVKSDVATLLSNTGPDVTLHDAVDVAQAVALWNDVGNMYLAGGLTDTAAHLLAGASVAADAANVLDWASGSVAVTVLDAVDVAQAVALQSAVAGHADSLTLAGGVSDSAAHWFTGDALSAGGAALLGALSAPSVTVDDGVDVAQAVALSAAVTSHTGTLTLAGGVADSVAHFFGSATGTSLVSGLPDLGDTVVTVSGAVSVAQGITLAVANGAPTLLDGVADSVAHFFTAPSGSTLINIVHRLAGDHLTITDAVSVAQGLALGALAGAGGVSLAGGVSDTAVGWFGSPDGSSVAPLSLSGASATVTGAAVSVAQAAALAAAVGASGTVHLAGLSDTAAHWFGSTAGSTLVSGLPDLAGDAVTVADALSVAQSAALHAAVGSGTVSYDTIADSAAHLASWSAGAWSVNPAIHAGTNVIVSTAIGADELAAIDAANGSATVTLLANLPAANFYAVETASTPAWTVSGGTVASVIDAAGAQTIHLAAGGKLNLSGADGNNVIVFDSYLREQLHVSASGTTVIFSDAAGAVASISTDAVYAASQTIQFSDHSQVSLTDSAGVLAINGVAIIVGSAPVTLAPLSTVA